MMTADAVHGVKGLMKGGRPDIQVFGLVMKEHRSRNRTRLAPEPVVAFRARPPMVPPAMKKQWALVWILSGLSMLGAFSIDAYLPSFNDIGKSLNVDREHVQQ